MASRILQQEEARLISKGSPGEGDLDYSKAQQPSTLTPGCLGESPSKKPNACQRGRMESPVSRENILWARAMSFRTTCPDVREGRPALHGPISCRRSYFLEMILKEHCKLAAEGIEHCGDRSKMHLLRTLTEFLPQSSSCRAKTSPIGIGHPALLASFFSRVYMSGCARTSRPGGGPQPSEYVGFKRRTCNTVESTRIHSKRVRRERPKRAGHLGISQF